ncbi:CocE/NonD family hydrolase C-terminal non-catalytic domain-containing protein [Nocardia acidivorans]|uniref:CocE/NonD family hydrolase C-terminal non-catalytic domain-containing protein n=1 Tax=Nocardia acidivorans TaxID=404580 RepID=UPI0008295FA3|nr:CocE/NonD family hydrolase C-terminal non-catalytic domain-containing protein [Nocardia acidivorans]
MWCRIFGARANRRGRSPGRDTGRAYPYNIAIWPTSYLVKAGYRIRVEVSSSDFPQFAPNPNTGEPYGATANAQLATQTIYHDAEHPSALILPVIPGTDTGSTRFPVGH